MTNDGLRGHDKQQSDLRDEGRDTPEGLKRPRQGPVDKNVGRAYEDATKQPKSQRGERQTEDELALAKLGGPKGSPKLSPAPLTKTEAEQMLPNDDPGHVA